MKTKKYQKVIASFLLLFMAISQFGGVFAATVGETKDLISLGECENCLLYRNSHGEVVTILTHYVVYNENGKQYPAYCLNANLKGVDDKDSYGVVVGDMTEIANNQAVWRVLLNGFPYKTAQEMGLDNDRQAFMVTKQAIYCVLDNRDINNYFGSNETGDRMANKVRELANIGRNGTQTYQDPVVSTNAVTEVGVDTDSNYISQTFAVDSQVNMHDIRIILNGLSAPEGTRVTDENNNDKATFNKGEKFKILIPKENIKSEINVQFSVSGQCDTYPILLGRAPSENLQDVVLTTDPFIMSTSRGTMTYKPSGEIIIEKISNGKSDIIGAIEGTGLSGAVFQVENADGSFSKEVTTGEDGKFVLTGLQLGEYTIYEKTAPTYFLKENSTKYKVNLENDGDTKVLKVENTPVEIKVNVEKDVDKEEAQGNELVTYEIDKIKNLSNVKLNNFTLTDDLPKEVRIQKLQTGTYNEDLKYSVYYSTNKKANIKLQDNLSTKENNTIDFTKVELAKDEFITSYSLKFGTVKIGFSNADKMYVTTKVIEGLQDKSKFINNVKVSGTYLEKKAEDKDDVPVEVYENTVEIYKTSKEYNQYLDKEAGSPVDGTVFEILDANKKYVATVKTANGGVAIYKYLETGKQYYLKEVSTAPYYVINDELIPFQFEKNGQVIKLDIKNDNVNLVVDVEKDGPTQAKQGEVITYNFNHIGNFSNVALSEFTWGDKLPKQVNLQSVNTGTWNEELNYKVQYITNKNTNWQNIGEEYTTTTNNTIDFTKVELAEDEYITEYRFLFGKVKAGFQEIEKPTANVKVNENLPNNKIFTNNTYVSGMYQNTKVEEKDEATTIVYTPEKTTTVVEKTPTLPKTGM